MPVNMILVVTSRQIKFLSSKIYDTPFEILGRVYSDDNTPAALPKLHYQLVESQEPVILEGIFKLLDARLPLNSERIKSYL